MMCLGFSRAKSFYKIGSQIIRESEKREYSHAYIKYTCPITNEVIVSQASHGFVNEVNYTIFTQSNIICEEYEIPCTKSQFIDILTFIKKNLGTPYSKSQILFIFIKKLCHVELNIENKDKEFICSEWAARIMQITGVGVGDKLDYKTPSDLNNLVRSLNLERV